MADLRHDLVLEYKTGERDEDLVKVILSNKPGQSYTFGSEYPGERKGEEFTFCKGYEAGIVNPTHCVISVDEQGLFWIENDTSHAKGRATRSSVYNTFVNSERVKGVEKRHLKTGDIVSLGYPQTQWAGMAGPGRLCHPIYHVKEQITQCSLPKIDEAEIKGELKLTDGAAVSVSSPLDNNLILSEIMDYLPVSDLKNARLVSKKWRVEASKVLEKKGQVSFDFGIDYVNPEHSTKVSRYLHEMKGLKLRNLHIRLEPITTSTSHSGNAFLVQNPLLFSPGEPGEKMLDDLRKLLASFQNISTLFLQGDIRKESEFLPFSLIMQKLGGKLVELKLKGDLVFLPVPEQEALPSFPLMTNLKKLSHKDSRTRLDLEDAARKQKWISHLVPLFANNLERFTNLGCSADLGSYLQEFTKQEMPKLKGIAFESVTTAESLSLLLELKTPLTSLQVKNCTLPGEGCTLLEKLLLKNSSSLQSLAIFLNNSNNNVITEVKFPIFPKLKELKLIYQWTTKVSWGKKDNLLNYKDHFPSLRNLKIVLWFRPDVADDAVLNSFFPGPGTGDNDNDRKCETMNEVWVALHPDWNVSPDENQQEDAPAQTDFFQSRIDKIRGMFPNALNMTFFQKGMGEHYMFYNF